MRPGPLKVCDGRLFAGGCPGGGDDGAGMFLSDGKIVLAICANFVYSERDKGTDDFEPTTDGGQPYG